jgi:2-polyprenyl-3-methyl-5-hydroxy-6-metoxy-1,4-benzoquinol methylase
LVDFPETADIETSSDAYAQRFTGEIGSWFLQVQEDATLRMLASHLGARVLDVGGGHGQLTQALVQHGYKVTVLGSADLCKQRIQTFLDAHRCAFTVGNILDLPYPNQAFDIVISYRLLPHVTQWKRFVSELTRVAHRVVMLDFPAVRSLNCLTPLLFHMKKRLEGNTRPYASFREAELLAMFQSLGFIRAERYPEFFLPMVLHRIVNSPRLSSVTEGMCRLAGLTSAFGSPVIVKLVRDIG